MLFYMYYFEEHVLSSSVKPCLQQLLLWFLINVDFYFYYFFYIYLLDFYYEEELFHLPYLFTQLFVYFCMDSKYLFKSMYYNLLLSLYIFIYIYVCIYSAQIIPDLTIEISVKLDDLSFKCIFIIQIFSLFSSTASCSCLTFYFLYLNSRNNYSFFIIIGELKCLKNNFPWEFFLNPLYITLPSPVIRCISTKISVNMFSIILKNQDFRNYI